MAWRTALVALTLAIPAAALAAAPIDAQGIVPVPRAVATLADARTPREALDAMPDVLADHRARGGVAGPEADTAIALARAALDAPDAQADPAAFVAWALALQPRPEPRSVLPAVPEFASLIEAIDAMHARYGGERDEATTRALRGLDDVNADALTRIVEAHLFSDAAARIALADPASPDLGLMALARDRVAAVVMRDGPRLHADPNLPDIESCPFPVYALGLSGDDSEWTCDVPLSIDLGGDDVYHSRAGATYFAQLASTRPPILSALHVDREGSDTYECGRPEDGFNGAGSRGAGHFFDFGGNDYYHPTIEEVRGGVVQGGAVNGTGLFVEVGGDDDYDVFTIAGTAAGTGGAVNGLGAFLDLGGNDTHTMLLDSTLGAYHGGAVGGSGLFVDAGGNDDVDGRIDHGAGPGAAIGGTAIFIDLDGNDLRHTDVGPAGAAHGAALTGIGVFVDAGEGDDIYRATGLAAHGASVEGAGIMIEAGGRDLHYPVLSGGASLGASLRGVGVLVGGSGDSEYWDGDWTPTSNVTLGAADLGGLGALFDAGGVNTFRALGARFAQGAGAHGGMGILVDAGVESSFILSGSQGLARGAQGVGMLLRTDPESTSTYDAYFDSRAFEATGGGVAILVDVGLADFRYAQPRETCRDGGVLGSPHACRPNDESRDELREPTTGDEVGPVSKEPIVCEDYAPPACNDLPSGTASWLARDSLTTTTSGGTEAFHYKDASGTTTTLRSEFVLADEMCEWSCVLVPGEA